MLVVDLFNEESSCRGPRLSSSFAIPPLPPVIPMSTIISPFLGSRPAFEYAHSVFATSCTMNVPASASARPSSSLITSSLGPDRIR